ncbi:MAG: Rieske (2Fe-2S) protein, partial [Amphiplicatus sp.]|nr:Rieske (2Fe-2S) protein [Amphiplicatus sp.]
MNTTVNMRDISVPEEWDRAGLPGWTYHSKEFLKLETREVFRTHWQIACHVSDIPENGSFITLDICGERALVIRGNDGEVRAFHNTCRHRGARVAAEERGRCKGALVCPFHGWVYNLDGTLRGAARPNSFPELDKNEFGLPPIDSEIWNGFVFIRFCAGPQPSVAELMAPFAEEMAHYRMADMVATSGFWTQTSAVNWKSVRDV